MNISIYTDYFHDGSLIDIRHTGDYIEFTLESFPIEEKYDFENRKLLSKEKTIKGKLKVFGVKKIIISDEEFKGVLTKEYDAGEIFDLEIEGSKVFLLIEWTNYPPKPRSSDVSKIEIEAESIVWENMPDLVTD